MSGYVYELISPETLTPIRDITHQVTAMGSVTWDISDELAVKSQIDYVGDAPWPGYMIRCSYTDGSISTPLCTCWATPTDARHDGIASGSLEMSGVLLAMKSQLTESTYAISIGAHSTDVIADACIRCGRPSRLDALTGDYRYRATVVYDAGTPWLKIAQDAANHAGLRVTQDPMGFIVAVRDGDGRPLHRWTTAGGGTSRLLGAIGKSSTFWTDPTRIIATYTDGDVTISAVAPSERTGISDAQTRGRQIDAVLNVNELSDPSRAALLALARESMRDRALVRNEWNIVAGFAHVAPGDKAIITDVEAGQTLTGRVSSVEISLTPGLPTITTTVRGTV